jgi:hypothetical protein
MGVLMPLEQAPLKQVAPEHALPVQTPPKQVPLELMTDEVMFRPFGLPSDVDDEENEGDEADEEEEDGGWNQDGAQQDGVSIGMGPSIGFYF